jgi:metal-responsive CopG/Arc/MetJ family transcriptional regulator
MIRTTLALPRNLLTAVDQLVRDGGARSRGDLVATALRREIAARQRSANDRSFAAMALDEEYQAEGRTIMAEFAIADEEAWSNLRD